MALIIRARSLLRCGFRWLIGESWQAWAENLLRACQRAGRAVARSPWRFGRGQAISRVSEGYFAESTDQFRSLLSEVEAGGLRWPYTDDARVAGRLELGVWGSMLVPWDGMRRPTAGRAKQGRAEQIELAVGEVAGSMRTLAWPWSIMGDCRAGRNMGAGLLKIIHAFTDLNPALVALCSVEVGTWTGEDISGRAVCGHRLVALAGGTRSRDADSTPSGSAGIGAGTGQARRSIRRWYDIS